jgi:hypothetical protein
MDLRIFRVLRDQAIPVAFVQSVQMLVQYGLGSRLGPDIRQLHFARLGIQSDC